MCEACEILRDLKDNNAAKDSYESLGQALQIFSQLLWSRGHFKECELRLYQALSVYTAMPSNNSDFPLRDMLSASRLLAWVLATCPEDDVRDGKFGGKLAMSICELEDWSNYVTIAALAAAEAEIGDFEKAIEHQRKAIQRAPDNCRKREEEVLDLFHDRQPRRDNALMESLVDISTPPTAVVE
jgi:tetratricopeptide (TPR) repeat protein